MASRTCALFRTATYRIIDLSKSYVALCEYYFGRNDQADLTRSQKEIEDGSFYLFLDWPNSDTLAAGRYMFSGNNGSLCNLLAS